MVEVQPAADEVADRLLAAGCRLESWSLPDELHDDKRVDGIPLTHDYVLDFHFAVHACDELAGSDELADC